MSNLDVAEARDLRRAIDALNHSTNGINQQIGAIEEISHGLEQQRRHAGLTTTAQPSTAQPNRHIVAARTAIEQYQASAVSSLQRATSTALITIDDTLSRHDDVFASLEDRAHDNHDVLAAKQTRIEELLNALEHSHAELIRLKLDRFYYETIPRHETYDSDIDKLHLVQNDLKALYTEIPSLSQMLVKHDYGDTINGVLARAARATAQLQSQNSESTARRIMDMATSLEKSAGHAELFQSHRTVVDRLNQHFASLPSADGGGSRSVDYAQYGRPGENRPNSALNSLAQYLGVDARSSSHGRTEVQNDEVFTTLKGHIEGTINVQAQQQTYLEDSGCGQARDGTEGGHQSLDELGERIGRLKAELDSVSN